MFFRYERLQEIAMKHKKYEVLQGTLDMLVLKTLEAIGPMHGWGVARRIQQVSDDALQLTQGTIYPALLRLEQHGWISARVGELSQPITTGEMRATHHPLEQVT